MPRGAIHDVNKNVEDVEGQLRIRTMVSPLLKSFTNRSDGGRKGGTRDVYDRGRGVRNPGFRQKSRHSKDFRDDRRPGEVSDEDRFYHYKSRRTG